MSRISSDARSLRAAAWMTTAQFLFAFMATGARIGGRNLPWQEVCAARFAVGALTAYVMARARGQSLRIIDQRAAWLRTLFGIISGAGTFYLYATRRLPIGDAATVLATAPLFVALLSVPLLGEPVRASVSAALVLGLVGIALVAQPSFSSEAPMVAVGTATAAISALSFIWLRRMGGQESSEAIVVHFLVVGSAVMIAGCIPVWRTPNLREAIALLSTGLFGGLAQIAMTRAYALDNAARVSVLGYSGLVFTRALAVPIFGEVPSPVQSAGSLLVIAAGVALAVGRAGAVERRGVPALKEGPP